MRISLFVFYVFSALCCLAQRDCTSIRIPATVAITGTDFTLADLLAPPVCPLVADEARQVRLGSAPLAGSTRVLDAGELRSELRKLDIPSASRMWWQNVTLPERISVHRPVATASCSELAGRALDDPVVRERLAASGAFAQAIQTGRISPADVECGAAGRVPRQARLLFTKVNWDAAARSWDICARCLPARDCVPFLIRVHLAAGEVTPQIRLRRDNKSAISQEGSVLVHRGGRATLIWEHAGIRLEVPVICLEPGRQGGHVKIRIERSNKVVDAVVTGAGRLRTDS